MVDGIVERLCSRTLEIVQIMLDNGVIGRENLLYQLGFESSRGSDLARVVQRFLEGDSVETFLCDADDETQQLARELRKRVIESS